MTSVKKLQVEKRSEIVMTSAAFQQMIRTLKEVEEKLKDQLEQQQKKAVPKKKPLALRELS